MTRSYTWILLLALIPLAFCGGWLLGQANPRGDSRAVSRITPNAGPIVTKGSDSSSLVQGASAPVGNATVSSARVMEASAPVAIAPEEVERLTRRVAQPDVQVAAGNQTVVGTVHSEAGLPLAGVIVRATPRDWKPSYTNADKVGRAAPPRESFNDWVSEQAEEFALEQARMIESVTDATGMFKLTGLAEGRFDLQAFHDGWIFKTPDNLRAPHFGELELMGIEVFDFDVRIENADGTLSTESEVVAESLDSGRSNQTFAWKPELPRVRLAPGNWKLTGRQRALDHPTSKKTIIAKSEEVSVSFEHGQQAETVVLVLEPKTSLVGRLQILPKPDEDTWFRIMLSPLDGSSLADLQKTLHENPKHDDWNRSTFSFSDLEPGPYAFGVLDQDNWNETEPTYLTFLQLDLVDGLNEQNVDVTVDVSDRVLLVDVTGPDSKPLAGCSFKLHVKDADGSSGDDLRTVKAHAGHYELGTTSAKTQLERAEKGGSLTLHARHKLHGNVSVPIAANATTAQLAFAETSVLEVTVGGWETMKDKIRVSLRHAGPNSGAFNPKLKKHDGGTWRFEPLQKGRYKARLSVRAQRWNWSQLEEKEIDVTGGTAYLAFELPQLHSLTLTARSAKPKARSRVRRIDSKRGSSSSEQLDDSLSATFSNLETGEYIVTVSGVDGMMRVRIPSPAIEFVGQAPNAMQVKVTDDEGLWSVLGLESGDLIVGVGGTMFANEQESMSLYEPGVVWTVWRNGKDMDIQAPAEPFGDRSRLGVTLTPTVRPSKR